MCFIFHTALSKCMSRKGATHVPTSSKKGLYCLPNTRIKFRVRKGSDIVEGFWNSQISKSEWSCVTEMSVFLNPYFFHRNFWMYNITSILSKFRPSRLVQNGQFLSFPTQMSKCASHCSTMVLVLIMRPLQHVWYCCVFCSIIFTSTCHRISLL